MSRYFHRTTPTAAEAILRAGFRNGVGTYMTDMLHSGVWLSDVPLDENEGARGDILLAVELPPEAVEPYEWIQEPSFGYREFLVPAEIINQRGTVRIASEGEAAGEGITLVRRHVGHKWEVLE